jgi:hypothetical protein
VSLLLLSLNSFRHLEYLDYFLMHINRALKLLSSHRCLSNLLFTLTSLNVRVQKTFVCVCVEMRNRTGNDYTCITTANTHFKVSVKKRGSSIVEWMNHKSISLYYLVIINKHARAPRCFWELELFRLPQCLIEHAKALKSLRWDGGHRLWSGKLLIEENWFARSK